MASRMISTRAGVAAIGAVMVAAVIVYWAWPSGDAGKPPRSPAKSEAAGAQNTAPSVQAKVDLSDSQLALVKVEPVAERDFPVEKEAVGSISFDEDMSVQVFTPYQGRIIALFAAVGDDVKQGQTLFTIDSPDLLQAESTLIAAAGVQELTTRNLARLQELYKSRAVSQRDLD